jgi:hypothetical protein
MELGINLLIAVGAAILSVVLYFAHAYGYLPLRYALAGFVLDVIAAVALVLARYRKRQTRIKGLGDHVSSLQIFESRLFDEPNEPDFQRLGSDWDDLVAGLEAFLNLELGNSYVVRSRDGAGVNVGTYPLLKARPGEAQMLAEVRVRLVRLHEFIAELNAKP